MNFGIAIGEREAEPYPTTYGSDICCPIRMMSDMTECQPPKHGSYCLATRIAQSHIGNESCPFQHLDKDQNPRYATLIGINLL